MNQFNKVLCTVCLLFSLSFQTQAQLQFADLSGTGAEGTTLIPRISWALSLYSDITPISEKLGLYTGVALNNTGFIFDTDTDRFKNRVITLGPEVGFGLKVGKLTLYTTYKLDLNLHYKSKTFVNKERSQKEIVHSEWFSNRTTLLGHSLHLGFILPNGVALSGGYYLNNFFNEDFSENIGGLDVRPYENITANRFEVGIGFTSRFWKNLFGDD